MNKHYIQNLEYINNKYYNRTPVKSVFSFSDNVKIYELINLIDTTIDFLSAEKKTGAVAKFNSIAQPYISELRSILMVCSQDNPELSEILFIIFDESIRLVEKYLSDTTVNLETVKIKLVDADKNLLEKTALMKEQGYLEFRFEETPEFLQWSARQLENARKKYENESDWRGANAYDPSSAEYKLVETFIKDNHITDIISAYKGMDMSMYYAAWDYSHNRQTWFRNNHEYDHISPTNYYHYDADVDIAKMLIYLTDVKKDDGAFRFVKGSNVMPRSTFLTYVFYAIDSKISPKFLKKENLYGRGLFLYRKDLLMQFPVAFMGTTHFGDDVIEGSQLSEYLLSNTVVFERQKGSAVLFDGYRGIHAGGNADKGERLAVQVAFKKTESLTARNSGKQKLSVMAVKQYVKNLIGK